MESSDLDQQDFNVDEYVKHVTATNGLADLLRLYTKVMGEVRALDAEKKALVYDNYNKLITATDTIRKVHTGTPDFQCFLVDRKMDELVLTLVDACNDGSSEPHGLNT